MKTILIWQLKSTLWLLTLLFTSFSVLAQKETKKRYTSNLDSLWSRSTYINKMTTDGKWVILTETFDHKKNVLMLKHTSDSITFKLPESQWIRFSDDNRWFGCITDHKELNLIDLVNHTKESYPNIQSYSFSKSGDYIAALEKDKDLESLVIINLKNKSVYSIQDVNKYLWHPQHNSLLLGITKGNQNQITLYDVDSTIYKFIKENPNSRFNYLFWSDSGNALMFLEQNNKESILNYYSNNGDLITLNDTAIENKFSHYQLGHLEPHISDDGKRVLFYRQLRKMDATRGTETMQVWNSIDPWAYPRQKEYEERELRALLTVWYPETNQLIAIETVERPTAALDVNHNHAIVFDKLIYEPLYKEFSNTDIYAKNMETGEEHLVVQNQYIGSGFVTLSPDGKYITYFKNKNWWVHNMKTSETINLTKSLNISFENVEKDDASEIVPFGNPGWLSNNEYIILYDQYDIWMMSPDGNYKKRITKGREEKMKYRISKNYRRNDFYFLTVNVNFSSSPFNLDNGVILEMYDDFHKTGYGIWKKVNKIEKVIFEDRKLDGILISEDFSNIVFRRQKFNEPHGIYNFDIKQKKEYLLYQSNEELLNYDLGSGQLIKYNIGEKELLGTLLFPTNFNPEKKYPMIVYIYEKTSNRLMFFEPPSDYEYIGFNSLKFTTDDYFVLFPDIAYTIQDPGISALNCVISAVNKVMESGNLDENKIGLVGHSFGGYESAFIATQTDMFAAVVAGAAVTNFTSHYHSLGWNNKKPEIWRYESQQWRMGDSYYNIKGAYQRNSPLYHVESLSSPLLLWTGKEDYQVHWTQSIELFLALKRLQKKSKLLLFENEPHALMNKANQKKLSIEIKTWFDKYCKNKNE
ncbi:S9 family peptidase [Gelidibacter maritimus]|uniref:Prolyl oligopeptidase family serine peptidase n=1 Tax=Gelidibacter maritimus TaxID=2761487 RepID=A0A7W2M597_9FLAO|nr:prolyl oligopeptidase family serine peptidase [Gelidibacter maritimus]MBA6152706.1 prolyl oligopeptidase family serine peptidase [Gelidibacter maritimus]